MKKQIKLKKKQILNNPELLLNKFNYATYDKCSDSLTLSIQYYYKYKKPFLYYYEVYSLIENNKQIPLGEMFDNYDFSSSLIKEDFFIKGLNKIYF